MKINRTYQLFALSFILISGCTLSEVCNEDRHFNDEGLCVPDTDAECGPKHLDCTALPGVVYAHCNQDENGALKINKKCSVQACKPGYHLVKGTYDRTGVTDSKGEIINYCEPDNANACGNELTDCTKIPGVTNVDCVNGQCKFSCQKDFHPDGNSCAPDTPENCGYYKINCLKSPGVTQAECLDGGCQTKACDTANDYQLINSDCAKIIKCSQDADCISDGYDEAYCEKNECIATKCSQNYHLSGKTCQSDTIHACGPESHNCTELENATSLSCEAGECHFSCETGTHLADNGCMADSAENCGFQSINCTKIENAVDTSCNQGSCVVNKCNDNYHPLHDSCEKDTETRCGNELTNCMSSGVESALCVNGACEIQSCGFGYIKKQNNCAPDESIQCSENNQSKCPDIHPNATSTSCEKGTCIATACSKNFHLSQNACEPDTDKICGNPPENCTIINNADAYCEEGSCRIKSCRGNTHIYGNICEENTDEHCGAERLNCTNTSIPNATKVTCNTNKCVPTECQTNSHLYNDTCELNTDEHCGLQRMDCNKLGIEGASSTTCQSGICIPTSCQEHYILVPNLFKCVPCKESMEIYSTTGIYQNNDIYCVDGTITMASNTKSVVMKNLRRVGKYFVTRENTTVTHCYDDPDQFTVEVLEKLDLPSLDTAEGIFVKFNEAQGGTLSLPALTTVNTITCKNCNEVKLPKLTTIKGAADDRAYCEVDFEAPETVDHFKLYTPKLEKLTLNTGCLYIGNEQQKVDWTYPPSLKGEANVCPSEYVVSCAADPLKKSMSEYYHSHNSSQCYTLDK